MKQTDGKTAPGAEDAALPESALSGVSGGTWTGTELEDEPAGRKWVQVAHVCKVVEDSSSRQASSEDVAAGEGAAFYVTKKSEKPLF
ncbi:MAG: hypothetical protein IK082_06595 [Oscillospiraceae bacterium]|nr:hypothetical protein [Oscillospiraceae bacterium]